MDRISKYLYVISIFISLVLFGCKENSTEPIIVGPKNDPLRKDSTSWAICYQKAEQAVWQTFVSNSTGGEIKSISINGTANHEYPMWSPDGKFVLSNYSETQGIAGVKIALYDVEKFRSYIFRPNFTYGTSAIFANDSKRIICNQADCQSDVISLADTNYTKRILGNISDPVRLCPDGEHFWSFINNSAYQFGISNSEQMPIPNIRDLRSINWKEKKILYMMSKKDQWYSSSIGIFDIANNTIDTLIKADAGVMFTRAKWSHDFTKFVYIETNYNTRKQTLVLFENGKKEALYTFNLDAKERIDGTTDLYFSPKDQYILFVKAVLQESETFWWKSYIYFINLQTKNAFFIHEGTQANWNPKLNY